MVLTALIDVYVRALLLPQGTLIDTVAGLDGCSLLAAASSMSMLRGGK